MSARPVEYQVLDPGDGTYMIVRFNGKLRDQSTTWRARIESVSPGSGSYIEVGEPSDQERDLRIGLPVTEIDRRTITKAIIMIQQYRNLGPGRHEFGENA